MDLVLSLALGKGKTWHNEFTFRRVHKSAAPQDTASSLGRGDTNGFPTIHDKLALPILSFQNSNHSTSSTTTEKTRQDRLEVVHKKLDAFKGDGEFQRLEFDAFKANAFEIDFHGGFLLPAQLREVGRRWERFREKEGRPPGRLDPAGEARFATRDEDSMRFCSGGMGLRMNSVERKGDNSPSTAR